MSYVLGDHPDRISSLSNGRWPWQSFVLSRNTLVVGYQPLFSWYGGEIYQNFFNIVWSRMFSWYGGGDLSKIFYYCMEGVFLGVF